MKIDWTALRFSSELMAISKSFMAYALEKYAPRTAQMFAHSLQVLSRTKLANGLPWDKTLLITFLENLKKSRHDLVGFRRFYRWAVDRGIKGFDLNTYLTIKDISQPGWIRMHDFFFRSLVLTLMRRFGCSSVLSEYFQQILGRTPS